MQTNFLRFAVFPVIVLALACSGGTASEAAERPREVPASASEATLAGGCFWCIESAFDDVDGVYAAISGYTGGTTPDPTYHQVSAGETDHVESVRVYYDPKKIGYDELLGIFWRQIDPTDDGGQFADRGSQYRTAIFWHGEEQRKVAERSKEELAASGRFDAPIVTRLVAAGPFYEAEEYHQDYHRKHPEHYKRYRWGSGRTPFLERVWGREEEHAAKRPPREELREKLSPMQFHVTQEDGTEPAFENEYWDNKAPGIYVDVVSGEPLFSSTDKFDSRTGWPSFTQPLVPANVTERADYKLGMRRVEVRSAGADSHLGHVFPDGPAPTGLRYCINSAALRFVPKERLAEEGLEEFAPLFAAGSGK